MIARIVTLLPQPDLADQRDMAMRGHVERDVAQDLRATRP